MVKGRAATGTGSGGRGLGMALLLCRLPNMELLG
jgi:hypothetical protein